jgi:glycosyltransferase involved in cell wall biosynthesis
MSLKLSVIVPAHNEEKFIEKCLDSLGKQTLNKKFYEVIVVDNASTDKTSKIVKRYPVKLVYEDKKSVIWARQKGVDSSSGEIIVSADADTYYPPDWLKTIKANFERNPKLICLVGWIYYSNTPFIFNYLMALNQEFNLLIQKYTKKFPVCYAANLAFTRYSLEEIGGYPKHLIELGDQQYLLYKFFRMGEVKIDTKVYCKTSARKLDHIWTNVLLYNGWHRIIGYIVNRLMGKEIIGPTPAIRTVTPTRKARFWKSIYQK